MGEKKEGQEIGKPVFSHYSKNIDYLKKELGYGKSFDVIHLDLEYAGRNMGLFTIDGFTKDKIILHMMKLLSKLKPEQLEPDPLEKLMKTYLPYIELSKERDLDEAVFFVLSGASCLVVEGADEVVIVDARTYPVRSPEEPELERVVRGPRDGFVETLIFNTALTRRRVRDNSLRMEYLRIGKRSKTDICLSFIDDIADPHIVKRIRHSLQKIETDGLAMGEKTVEEFLTGRSWNPYLTFRYTERPDTAAAHLFEGHVLVMVDGSPSVIITPATFWGSLQYPEEYRQRPVVGIYLRFIRYFSVLASIILLPLWFLLVTHPDLLPDGMAFIGPKEEGNVPLFLQVLLIEFGMDMLRMATIHTPKEMGSALGLIAAVLIGQMAVEVGLFTNEVILYLSIAAIGAFATPYYELALANRLFRLVLLVLVAVFGVPGFMIGITFWVLFLTRLKSFNIPYLWPILPFSPRSAWDVLIRKAVPLQNRRPKVLHPKDPTR